jgi:hypothetical protein
MQLGFRKSRARSIPEPSSLFHPGRNGPSRPDRMTAYRRRYRRNPGRGKGSQLRWLRRPRLCPDPAPNHDIGHHHPIRPIRPGPVPATSTAPWTELAALLGATAARHPTSAAQLERGRRPEPARRRLNRRGRPGRFSWLSNRRLAGQASSYGPGAGACGSRGHPARPPSRLCWAGKDRPAQAVWLTSRPE